MGDTGGEFQSDVGGEGRYSRRSKCPDLINALVRPGFIHFTHVSKMGIVKDARKK